MGLILSSIQAESRIEEEDEGALQRLNEIAQYHIESIYCVRRCKVT